jgi:hypothetical protein
MRLPRQPKVAVWIERKYYDALKALSPNDSDLPDTYDEWFKLATEQIAKLEASSITVNKVVINPQEFAAWCKASGVETNNATLGGFAIALHHKKNRRAVPGTGRRA